MDKLATSSIPSKFQPDFQDSSQDSDEELVQCCKFPARERRARDNSTIIVFEKVPYVKSSEEEVNNAAAAEPVHQIPSLVPQKYQGISQQIEGGFLEDEIINDKGVANKQQGESSAENQIYKFKSCIVNRYFLKNWKKRINI